MAMNEPANLCGRRGSRHGLSACDMKPVDGVRYSSCQTQGEEWAWCPSMEEAVWILHPLNQ